MPNQLKINIEEASNTCLNEICTYLIGAKQAAVGKTIQGEDMAIQFIPLVMAIVGGAATVGVGAYAYKSYTDAQEEPTAALIQPAEKPEIKPEIKEEPKVEIAQPKLPEFQVLTVEEDGTALIAGTAPDNSGIEIIHGDEVIATAQAGSNGDFVIVLDEPLEPGTYELFIRATPKDGPPVLSAQAGIISIPERGGEMIVMLTKPGEASELVQVPKPAPKPVAKAEPEPVPVPVAKVEPKPEPKPVVKIEPKPEPKPVVKIEPKPEPVIVAKVPEPKPEPEPIPDPVAPVLLGAVEVEGNKLFIAGSGEAGRVVNIYLNDKFIGETVVTAQGTFLLETETKLDFGTHKIRADMLAKSSAVVIARAEVPLIHDAPPIPKPVIVAKAPEPKVEPEPARNLGAVEIEIPQPAAAPKRVIRTGTSVIIRKGDNLWRVSRRILGRGIRYSTIYNANRDQIKNPSLIFPGQIFKVPGKIAGVEKREG